MPVKETLYLFIDESGNFDFSPGGTKYFILNVLSTTEPGKVAMPLVGLRYRLLPFYSGGDTMEEEGFFHASEDTQEVRNQVFAQLLTAQEHVRLDAVIAQKNRANPVFHENPVRLYMRLGESALRFALGRVDEGTYDHLVMVFSSVFDKKKRGILKQAFKALLKQHARIPYALYFHDTKSDPCAQAADYLGWAVYRKWERGDSRSYDIIKHVVRTEFSIFEKGTTEYYAR